MIYGHARVSTDAQSVERHRRSREYLNPLRSTALPTRLPVIRVVTAQRA
jgi:hypothetical protein